MSKCKCSMSISMLGDGCRYCQPQQYIDKLAEWLEESRAEATTLEAECERLLDLLADWSSHFTGPKVIGGPLSSLRERTDAALLNGGRDE